jgi:hypothetical protein
MHPSGTVADTTGQKKKTAKNIAIIGIDSRSILFRVKKCLGGKGGPAVEGPDVAMGHYAESSVP